MNRRRHEPLLPVMGRVVTYAGLALVALCAACASPSGAPAPSQGSAAAASSAPATMATMATTPTPPGHATKQAASTLTKVVASLKKIYGDQAVACGGSPDDPPDFVVNPNETIEMTCFVALENGALSAAEDSAIATVMVEASEDGSDVWPLIVGSRSAAALFAGQGYALYANEGQDAALSASIAKRLGLVEH